MPQNALFLLKIVIVLHPASFASGGWGSTPRPNLQTRSLYIFFYKRNVHKHTEPNFWQKLWALL